MKIICISMFISVLFMWEGKIQKESESHQIEGMSESIIYNHKMRKFYSLKKKKSVRPVPMESKDFCGI